MKVSKEEMDDGLSDHKKELMRHRKKKKRKFKNSFLYADNLISWKKDELETVDRKPYSETLLEIFDERDKKKQIHALLHWVKPDHEHSPKNRNQN